MRGVSLAPETIRTLTESHGKAMATFQPKDEATARTFGPSKGEVEFAVDAGQVNTGEQGGKDLKIAAISKREAGASVTPDRWPEDRLPEATAVVSFAMIAASKVFRKMWAPSLRPLGVKEWSGVQALGDGASWIWKSVGRVLPGGMETLDIYHAGERLSGCAQKIFGEGTPEATTSLERGRTLLRSEGWTGVCKWVCELLAVEAMEEQGRRQKATRSYWATSRSTRSD